jgi:hypothetical protein
MANENPVPIRTIKFQSPVVDVGTDYTTIVEVKLNGYAGICAFEVAPVGRDFNGFKVQVKAADGGSWHDYLVDTDFDAVDNTNMLFATATGPHEVAAAAAAMATIRLNAVHAVRFQGKRVAGDPPATAVVRGTIAE